MSDPTNLSDPVPAPPVARWSEPPSAPRFRNGTRKKLLRLGGVGGTCALAGAALATFFLHSATPEAAHADEHDAALRIDGDSIVLTKKLAGELGLRTVPVQKAVLAPLVTTTGTVTFDPRYTAAIGTRIPGLVRHVTHFEGDVVKANESLAVLEGAELGGAQAEVLSLRAHENAAEHSFEREEGLGARGLSSARRMEAAAARYSVLQSKRAAAEQRVSALGGGSGAAGLGVHRLRSPIAGTIVERHVNAGESVEDHRVAFRVADLDHLWVELSVVEFHVRGVRQGDAVEVCALASASPGDCVQGTVAHVGEQVDPFALAVTVRIEVDNRERKLRAGQAVSAKIRPSGGAPTVALVVPRSAVVRVDGEAMVFVETADRRIVPTKVELAECNEREQRVVSGVSEGQVVVSEGTAALTTALFR